MLLDIFRYQAFKVYIDKTKGNQSGNVNKHIVDGINN